MVPESMRLSRSCAGVDWRQSFGPRMLALAARIRRADAPEILPSASGSVNGRISNIDSRAMEASDSVLIDEPISQADHRLDLPPGRAELAAEPADMDVDRPRFDEPVVPPDALEQPITRDDTLIVMS